MHHHRVDLNGPASAISKVVAEVGRPSDGTTVVIACEEGIEFWEAISRRHPHVTFGIECFEALENELLHAVIQNGEATVMARNPVLPSNCGSFHDEDGEPIDDARLRAAAERVSEQRLRYRGRPETGLATAITVAKALGRICHRLEPTMYENTPGDALDAVVELAVLALWTASSGSYFGPPERDFQHALRITQCMVHAGRSEFRCDPDELDWSEWMRWLIGATTNVIDAATHVWLEPGTELHAVGSEHHSTPAEQVEAEALSLLTMCIEALALFGDAQRSAI